MRINRRNFPPIMRDNDENYISHLIGVINSVDELSSLDINCTLDSYHFRIAPSVPMYTQSILRAVLTLNTLYGIHVDLSKSIRTSSTITFSIDLTEE